VLLWVTVGAYVGNTVTWNEVTEDVLELAGLRHGRRKPEITRLTDNMCVVNVSVRMCNK